MAAFSSTFLSTPERAAFHWREKEFLGTVPLAEPCYSVQCGGTAKTQAQGSNTSCISTSLYIVVTFQTSKCRYCFQAKFFSLEVFHSCLIKEWRRVSRFSFAGGSCRALQAGRSREQNVLHSSSKDI